MSLQARRASSARTSRRRCSAPATRSSPSTASPTTTTRRRRRRTHAASTSCLSTSPRTTLDLHGVDGVFHLAGQPGVRSFGDVFPLYLRRNVLATQRVFRDGRRGGVRVVFASSSSVYGEAERYPTPEEREPRPISPYGITKLACEHLAHAYATGFGLDEVVLRYFTVYGPRQRPDMFFAPRLRCAPGRLHLRALRQRRAVAQLHRTSATRSRRRSRRWRERRGRALQRRRRRGGVGAGGDPRARGGLEAHARRPAGRSRARRRPPHEGGRVAHPRGLGWEPRH